MIPRIPSCSSISLTASLLSILNIHYVQATGTILNIPNVPGSQTSFRGPWTHQPYCIDTTSGKAKKYCVFTSQTYGSNGLSIVATPKIGKKAVELLDEDEFAMFLTPEQEAKWNTSNPPYEVVEIPGKDKGLVATKKIRKFETFMIDKASIVVDLNLKDSVPHSKYVGLLQQAVGQLKNPALIKRLSRKGAIGVDLVEDVLMTNSFNTDLVQVPHSALFQEVARINHACNPNSFVMFSQSGLSIGIKAYRDILPGEEITTSYVHLGKTKKGRHAELKRWGFKCNCSMCSAEESEIEASDSNRKRIEEGKQEMFHAYHQGETQQAVTLGEEIVELMEEEGLAPMLTETYVILARIHLTTGDRERAEKYGDLAVRVLQSHGFLGTVNEHWDLERLLASYTQ